MRSRASPRPASTSRPTARRSPTTRHARTATTSRPRSPISGTRSRSERTADAEADELADLRPRLVVSIVLTIPLILISMVPPLMFDGWQWVAFVLSTPVILWAAWPFHRATLVNLRHGATTMDTLVSLGTLAAYVWSAVALVFLGAADHDGGMSLGAMFTGGDGERTSTSRRPERSSRCCCSGGSSRPAPVAARATRSARCSSSAPRPARLENGDEVPVESLRVGDRFVVRPGREDRDRRPRRRRRVGGRRVDAHRRAGAGRRRAG